MQEKEYVNVGNLARLRTAMRLMQECVFLDDGENKRCQTVIHDICGLEFHTNNKIKIAPQKARESKYVINGVEGNDLDAFVDHLLLPGNCNHLEEICLAVLRKTSETSERADSAERAFAEWIHYYLENEHVPTDAHGWLKRAWLDAWAKARSLPFGSTNSGKVASPKPPKGNKDFLLSKCCNSRIYITVDDVWVCSKCGDDVTNNCK